MEVLKALEGLAADEGDLVFREGGLHDLAEVADRATTAVLHADPEIVVLEVAAQVIDDVGVGAFREDLDFPAHVLEHIGLIDADDLDGHDLSSAVGPDGFEDMAETALAEFFLKVKQLRGVSVVDFHAEVLEVAARDLARALGL